MQTVQRPPSIIVVGSSGNGKTTLVNGLRAYTDDFVFPKRYITRPQRKGDDLIENKHVTQEVFDHLLDSDSLAVAWQRPLGKDRYERYGFERLSASGFVPVYSANNALLRDKDALLPKDFLNDSFIILMKASNDIRRERVFNRSPDIQPEEMDIRLKDDGLDLASRANLVIDTGVSNPEEAVSLARRSTGY